MSIVAKGITTDMLPRQIPHDVSNDSRTFAYKRMTEAFNRAVNVPFDHSSRIVFFSDCHRGDNSRADAFARNKELFLHTLTYYYHQGFTYVEVGDGDELWKNRRFSDVRRTYGRIFDLLHQFNDQGRLHFILGNHEIQSIRRNRVVEKDGIIAHEGLILQHAQTGQQVFVVHGHQVDSQDRFRIVGRLAVRHLWRRFQVLFPASGVSRAHDSRRRRELRRRITEWLQNHRQVVICGHTHLPASATYDAPPYFNTGSCLYSGYITGLEIENGEIRLVKWSAHPGTGEKRVPSLRRELLAPPRKLDLITQSLSSAHRRQPVYH